MRRWLVVPSFIAASLVSIGSATAGGAPHVGLTGRPTIPISASTTTAGASSVVIAMGHLDDPSNTFWEMFVRPAGGDAWVLHTPPGVASNGGLVVAAPPSRPLAVGFLTSGALGFSPLAASSDGGRSWIPGQLPSPLEATPDALAEGPTGHDLALVTGAGERVLAASSGLTVWRTLTSSDALAQTTASCALQAVTAVAFTAASQPLLGLECARGDAVGVVVERSSAGGRSVSWREIGPRGASGGGASQVIRLVSTGSGVAGLAELGSGRQSSLVAFWGHGLLANWSESTPLSVGFSWTVTATATGGASGQSVAVLLGAGEQRRVEAISGPGARWESLPASPRGASGVVVTATGLDTFVVSGSHLAIWSWEPGASRWHESESISVPVPYGSSS